MGEGGLSQRTCFDTYLTGKRLRDQMVFDGLSVCTEEGCPVPDDPGGGN